MKKDEIRNITSAIVTGPTGAVGQALCRTLLSLGIYVYAVCKPNSSRTDTLPNNPNLSVIPCDLEEIESIIPIIEGKKVDVFFHLAWAGNDGNNRNNMSLQIRNIQYTIIACQIASELGCQLFLGAGSQAEYGLVDDVLRPNTPCFPESGYGMAKLCAGQMSRKECLRLGIDHIWARILSVYGPYEQLSSMTISTITKLMNGDVPAMTAGEQIWDYLYADDVADALYRMAIYGHNGAIYPVGSGQARPLHEYVEMIRDAVDPTLHIDFGAIPYASNQVMHLEADISPLTEDTGFIPMTDFRKGIKKTVEWVRNVVK